MKQLTFCVVLSSVFLFYGVVLAENTSTSTPVKITIEKRVTPIILHGEDVDNFISSQVRVLLRTDPGFADDKITISTKDHVVTLKGLVLSEKAKQSLGEKAKTVQGVTSVNNELEIPKADE